jgi:hypothetical protein
MFVGSTIQPVEGFSHHVKLGLTVPFENSGMALPEHLGNEVIGDTASTESRRERVTQLVKRKVRYASQLQCASPGLLQTAEVRLPAACCAARKQIIRADSLFHLFFEGGVRRFRQRYVSYSGPDGQYTAEGRELIRRSVEQERTRLWENQPKSPEAETDPRKQLQKQLGMVEPGADYYIQQTAKRILESKPRKKGKPN